MHRICSSPSVSALPIYWFNDCLKNMRHISHHITEYILYHVISVISMTILCNKTFVMNLLEPVPFPFPWPKCALLVAKLGQVKHCLVTCNVWDFKDAVYGPQRRRALLAADMIVMGVPQKWLVYNDNHPVKKDDGGGTPMSGNLHFVATACQSFLNLCADWIAPIQALQLYSSVISSVILCGQYLLLPLPESI